MKRRIITIDETRCNGCGLCARACHEGAIGIVEGKAKLLREDYCDGLGDCLPACPMQAITFEEREAPAYNEVAVMMHKKLQEASQTGGNFVKTEGSCLANFPVQIKLVATNAPYFAGADLLIAADCTAYSYANFHNDFMKNRITLIGCPKLDAVSYGEKLTEIFRNNAIRSVTVARMTVPCCGGLTYAVKTALENCGKEIPLYIVTISPKGEIMK
jgi:NAD-dependent dihydropyrimidine dehydrogenase PreA subunit